MLKKIVFSIVFFTFGLQGDFLPMQLVGREPVALLRLEYKQNSFECLPYGVVTLDEVYMKKATTNLCKRKIERFFKAHPKLFHISSYYLKTMQYYMTQIKQGGCIVHIQGERSFSQLLLAKGVGVIRRGFKDEEYGYLFDIAQKSAKRNKRGIWGEPALYECIVDVSQ